MLNHKTEFSNISSRIEEKLGRSLHNQSNHPIEIVKRLVYSYPEFAQFQKFNDLSPIVTTTSNFDNLLIKKDHPARRKSDTFYVNQNTVLRTHTSAHESEIIAQGIHKFLVTGDVYRKDEVDRTHYPVFHQTEGVCLIEGDSQKCAKQLIECITGLVKWLFPGCESRVNDDYFPFTNPSFEVEVKYQGEWLEILGCGVLEPEIMKNNGLEGKCAWAFGLGLERLAMILFNIPDIRCFWSVHPRFLEQFKSINPGDIVIFKPFSVLPSQYQDISFWIPKHRFIQETIFEEGKSKMIERWNQDNDFFGLIRDICGDWVEKIELKDYFFHTKKQSHSRMYRITYSPNDPDMKSPGQFNTIVLQYQKQIREIIENGNIEVTLR